MMVGCSPRNPSLPLVPYIPTARTIPTYRLPVSLLRHLLDQSRSKWPARTVHHRLNNTGQTTSRLPYRSTVTANRNTSSNHSTINLLLPSSTTAHPRLSNIRPLPQAHTAARLHMAHLRLQTTSPRHPRPTVHHRHRRPHLASNLRHCLRTQLTEAHAQTLNLATLRLLALHPRLHDQRRLRLPPLVALPRHLTHHPHPLRTLLLLAGLLDLDHRPQSLGHKKRPTSNAHSS